MVEPIEILTYWHFCFTSLLNGDFAEGGRHQDAILVFAADVVFVFMPVNDVASVRPWVINFLEKMDAQKRRYTGCEIKPMGAGPFNQRLLNRDGANCFKVSNSNF